jgi:hypothetical protein
MLVPEVKKRVWEQISIIEKKINDIDDFLKTGKKEAAVFWLFMIYENAADTVQDIKDNKKTFETIINHLLKINIIRMNFGQEYSECLEKLNKAKNIGAYGRYADERYSAPITDSDITLCQIKAKKLILDLKEFAKRAEQT